MVNPQKKLNESVQALELRFCEARTRQRFLAGLIQELDHSFLAILSSFRYRIGDLLIDKLLKRIIRRYNRAGAWAPEEAAALREEFKLWMTLHRHELFPKEETSQGGDSSRRPEEPQLQQALQPAQNDIQLLTFWLRRLQHLAEEVFASRRYRTGNLLVNIGEALIPRRNKNEPGTPGHIQQILRRYEEWAAGIAQLQNAPGGGAAAVLQEGIRITQFTPPVTANPYYTIIAEELQRRGWNFGFCNNPAQLLDRLKLHQYPVEIVHFHQLEPYYHSNPDNAEATSRRADDLIKHLRNLKQSGFRLVWTKHNPLPHDRKFQEIDRRLIEGVAPLMDHIIVLGGHAKRCMRSLVPADRITIIPHPSFRQIYGEPPERADARKAYGLDEDAFVFGSVGEIKPYKGCELLIEAMQRLTARIGPGKAKLLMAGRPHDLKYAAHLQASAGDDTLIIPEEVPARQLSAVMSALDSAVFAFKDIWGSSSVVLALSYELPVIAPQLGCMPDYVSPDNTGFLYRPGDPEDLCQRMFDMMHSPLKSHMRYMCRYFNRTHTVEAVAAHFEELYRHMAACKARPIDV